MKLESLKKLHTFTKIRFKLNTESPSRDLNHGLLAERQKCYHYTIEQPNTKPNQTEMTQSELVLK